MDNNRKQEIQNQIAELQRELKALSKDVYISFRKAGREEDYCHTVMAKSLSDSDVIDALNQSESISFFADSDITVWCDGVNYEQDFHVTRNVSYNITPF
jgi:hypothetical protein